MGLEPREEGTTEILPADDEELRACGVECAMEAFYDVVIVGEFFMRIGEHSDPTTLDSDLWSGLRVRFANRCACRASDAEQAG
jgi:hypothetical protein